MTKDERFLLAVFIVAAILALLGLLYSVTPTAAHNDVPVCQQQTEAGVAFVFSPVPDRWLGLTGWYFIGDDATLDGHTLTVVGLQFDNGYAYAVAGAADNSDNVTAYSDTTPPCGDLMPPPTDTPQPAQNALNTNVVGNPPYSATVSSTGRTCVVHYPQIVLVCNEHP